MDFSLHPVAFLRTCYPQKFGVPRQSGLVPAAWGEIVFEPGYRRPEAVRGIEGFSHLWLITVFHQVAENETSLLVRPPRLGGNERVGVFATRSPFRPNRLALSVVKLEKVDAQEPRLYVSGVDLVDGTPVLDIKPYVPYADAPAQATGGFADAAPAALPVRWTTEPVADPAERALIEQSIALQPQPAYQTGPGREYGARLGGHEVRWLLAEGTAQILQCLPAPRE